MVRSIVPKRESDILFPQNNELRSLDGAVGGMGDPAYPRKVAIEMLRVTVG